MTSVQDFHRDETIAYVLGCVRNLHQNEQACVTIYGRQPYAVALEHIARERAGRLEQLVRAIEAGLFDQLDASETGGVTAADVDPETGRDYAEEAWQRADAEREGAEELAAEQAAIDGRPSMVLDGHEDHDPFWSAASFAGDRAAAEAEDDVRSAEDPYYTTVDGGEF